MNVLNELSRHGTDRLYTFVVVQLTSPFVLLTGIFNYEDCSMQ